jgi:uncharacterized protein YbaR (Trm112 family)
MAGSGEQETEGRVPEGAGEAAHTDRRVLSMLVCPCTRTELLYDGIRQELISRAARLAFPIRDGVPVMARDEARCLDDDELRALAKRCGAAKPSPTG